MITIIRSTYYIEVDSAMTAFNTWDHMGLIVPAEGVTEYYIRPSLTLARHIMFCSHIFNPQYSEIVVLGIGKCVKSAMYLMSFKITHFITFLDMSMYNTMSIFYSRGSKSHCLISYNSTHTDL